MIANLDESGNSVYTAVPIEVRTDSSVYRLTRELTLARGLMTILDVGCSDGVAAHEWPETKQKFVGLDIAEAALMVNVAETTVLADARKLPFRTGSFDGILALDIVEHFKPKEAIAVLKEMQRVGALGHTAIVSMPVVDPTRLFAVREAIGAIRHGRPKTGLFDATHHIMRGARFHKKLFAAADYDVAHEYGTIGMTNGARTQGGDVAVRSTQASTGESLGKKLVNIYEAHEEETGLMVRTLGHLLTYQKVYELREVNEPSD